MPTRAHRCLAPGATIALIAPAGPIDDTQLRPVRALLAAHGYKARLFPSCHARGGYLAGPDADRLADLHAAYSDDGIAAIWCLRGGYGAGRLLPGIDLALLRRHPRLLIGYSDITALHALLDREDQIALHAPMPASDLIRPGREDDAKALFDWLRDGLLAGSVLAPTLADGAFHLPGSARGRLVGGNLSLIAALCGTPWQLRTEGAILFIEDVSESLYRVDRLLCQLKQSGLLDAAAGFVLGSFTEDADPRAVLADALLPLGKPVLGGWPAGHGTPNRPLPLGADVILDASAGTLTVTEDVLVK